MSSERDRTPSFSPATPAVSSRSVTDFETASPSRYVWAGILTVVVLILCCVAAFWLLARSAAERGAVPNPLPGSRARIEVIGPLLAGQLFSVRGDGFQSNETVEIFIASSPSAPAGALQRLGDAVAGEDGAFRRDNLSAPNSAGQYYLIARGAVSGFTQFTPVFISGDLVPTRLLPEPSTPAPAGPLPDLILSNVAIELETGASCAYISTQLGVRVIVQNIGSALAGPFLVQANNQQQLVQNGLAPGQTVSLWFPGFTTGPNRVAVDPVNMVAESNEDNNIFDGPLAVPTLPATCTPPVPTAIVSTPTPNPNPIGVWYGQYFGNPDLIPPVLFDQNLPGPALNVNWGTGAPGAGVQRGNWSAIFTSNVNFPTTDNYQFTLSVDGGARVFVDDILIVNQWFNAGLRTVTADVSLTSGLHNLRVEYYKSGTTARLALSWKISYIGWEGRYYNTPNLTGPVVVKRDDPLVSPNPPGFLINTGIMPNWPPAQVNSSNFSVDWRRSVNFPIGGTYVFTATVDDGVRLLIDGMIVPGIDDFTTGAKTLVGTRTLNAGQHFLQVQYVNYAGPGSIRLEWALLPPPATATATPTIPSPTPTNTPSPPPATETFTPSPAPSPTFTNTPTLPTITDTPTPTITPPVTVTVVITGP